MSDPTIPPVLADELDRLVDELGGGSWRLIVNDDGLRLALDGATGRVAHRLSAVEYRLAYDPDLLIGHAVRQLAAKVEDHRRRHAGEPTDHDLARTALAELRDALRRIPSHPGVIGDEVPNLAELAAGHLAAIEDLVELHEEAHGR